MRAFVELALFAAWICVVIASPVPNSRYSDSDDDQTAYKAEDHLFNDEGFPLRVRPQAHAQEFAGFPGEDAGRLFNVPAAREQTPYNDPFSGFFFDMQDMMKILRDQMSEVLTRVPESSVGHEDHLRPSDVQNHTSTKVEYLDGHKVVINDTTYSNGDTNHGTIFHVQIVDLLPLEPDEHPVETPDFLPAPAPAPSKPKTISNEIDSGKTHPEERDREEVEEDDDEIGEDIDEIGEKDVKPKPAKTTVRKETKEKPKEKEVKAAEKGEEKNQRVEKREKLVAKEPEAVDEVDHDEDEEEGEDITDKEEKKVQQKGDAMDTAESRWANEVDNRIDTYQPYYKPNKQNYNRFSNYYYEPYYKQKPSYNSYQTYNPDQPKYNNPQPVYNPNQYNFESTYKPDQANHNFEPAYKPEQPSYNNFESTYRPYQPSYNSPQPMYNAQPGYNSFDSTYKADQPEYNSYPKDNDRFMDLSSDTKVNDFMASQQQAGLIMVDPDAEIIDIDKKPMHKYPRYNYRKY